MEPSKKVNLTIDARIISHLGEALIDNEKIALLELIKNSSDADANNCTINIDTSYQSKYGQGRIVIEDDGNGMNPYILENAFLKIATSFKSNHQKLSPKFGRQAQGNKGIGRLSLNQLGRFIVVDTKVDSVLKDYMSSEQLLEVFGCKSEREFIDDNDLYSYRIEIDWEKYNTQNSTSIENVELDLQTNIFNETIFEHKKEHGTRIEVLGLKGIDFWRSKQTQKEIEQDVLEFLNPYLEERFNFFVKIILDGQIFRNDKYDIQDIENNYFSKAIFNYNSEKKNLNIEIYRSKKYIDFEVDKLLSKMDKYEFDKNSEIPYSDYYNQFDKETINISLESISSIKKDDPSLNLDKFVISDNKKGSNSQKNIFLPGNFYGKIFAYDLSSSNNFRKLLAEIRGVKVYRNNFRIFPYGEKTNDWLGMGDYNSKTAAVIYKAHTTTGFINIDGEENLERLKELTNRQGLVLDGFGTNFLLIIREIIYKIIAKRDIEFSNYFHVAGKKAQNSKPKEELTVAGISFIKQENDIEATQNDAKELYSNFDSYSSKQQKEMAQQIYKKSQNISRAIEKKEDILKEGEKYLQEFAPIMGATIIAETLAHEIIRLSNNIKSYSNRTRKAITNGNEKEAYDNLVRLDSSNKFLSRYASQLDANSSSKRRKYAVLNIKDEIINLLKENPLLTYMSTTVKLNFYGDGFETKLEPASFKIIIENLLINSTYWLDRMEIENPTINFKFDSETGKLYVFDNGIGIDKRIEMHIFDAFSTNKPDGEGRGMGLYIVSALLNEIGATIGLDTDKNQFGNKYKFVITF